MFVWKKYNKFVHRNWRIPQCLYFVSTPLLIFILLLLKKIPGKKCPSTRVSFSPLSIFDTASNTARRAALSPPIYLNLNMLDAMFGSIQNQTFMTLKLMCPTGPPLSKAKQISSPTSKARLIMYHQF